MILTILAIWFGYKKAKDTGRNPYLWAAICGGAFIGIQIAVAVGAGVFIAMGVEIAGWDEGLYDTYSWLISLASIGCSIIGLLLLFRYLDRVPQEAVVYEPPPPPTFGNEGQPH